ncbi:hypothetical protein SAY86_012601 [Trapa natans]|uniref:TPX2 C-terminal domain-containing protein n=1 Tax=Trapa natans TaxID=22666 RepID=A0AAN7LXY2_TRANT|nr:hypothetical protein SAY86_012601 [Trapa natans]
MGVEITDICMDKVQGQAPMSSNGQLDSLKPQELLDSYDDIKGDSESPASEENNGAKEYEVKECTCENPVKIEEPNAQSLKEKSKLEVNRGNVKNKRVSSTKNGTKHTAVGPRTKHTVPQPFALATTKRASAGTPPAGTQTDPAVADSNKSLNEKPLQNLTSKKSISPPLARKPLHPDKKKQTDEEDLCLVDSPNASAESPSQKAFASAPMLRCTQRAEKRREFSSKLEVKHQAMEAEKNQSEARTKEEREADIKQLRKSMTFKATPMPSFYHEGPPPKIQLKKMPPTRAKSPKLGRRKSSGHAVDPSKGEKVKGTHGCGGGYSLSDNLIQAFEHEESG